MKPMSFRLNRYLTKQSLSLTAFMYYKRTGHGFVLHFEDTAVPEVAGSLSRYLALSEISTGRSAVEEKHEESRAFAFVSQPVRRAAYYWMRCAVRFSSVCRSRVESEMHAIYTGVALFVLVSEIPFRYPHSYGPTALPNNLWLQKWDDYDDDKETDADPLSTHLLPILQFAKSR
jgi:hypothetical protein